MVRQFYAARQFLRFYVSAVSLCSRPGRTLSTGERTRAHRDTSLNDDATPLNWVIELPRSFLSVVVVNGRSNLINVFVNLIKTSEWVSSLVFLLIEETNVFLPSVKPQSCNWAPVIVIEKNTEIRLGVPLSDTRRCNLATRDGPYDLERFDLFKCCFELVALNRN